MTILVKTMVNKNDPNPVKIYYNPKQETWRLEQNGESSPASNYNDTIIEWKHWLYTITDRALLFTEKSHPA